MGRRSCTFKQLDLTRALRAAKAAGLEVSSVTVDRDGKIKIEAGKPAETADEKPGSGNEWDEKYGSH
jgi:hypothetical protein